MNIDSLRELCRALPAVTEDIKWGHDLCFSVAGKMFCVAALEGPLSVSFKVKDEEFDELSNSPGLRPAPYVARYKWVLVEDVNKLSRKEWSHYVKQSYDLVRAKLPKKLKTQSGLDGPTNGTRTTSKPKNVGNTTLT
jgi:predicted DNA-binding protein (MmcQ/YjbR family)